MDKRCKTINPYKKINPKAPKNPYLSTKYAKIKSLVAIGKNLNCV